MRSRHVIDQPPVNASDQPARLNDTEGNKSSRRQPPTSRDAMHDSSKSPEGFGDVQFGNYMPTSTTTSERVKLVLVTCRQGESLESPIQLATSPQRLINQTKPNQTESNRIASPALDLSSATSMASSSSSGSETRTDVDAPKGSIAVERRPPASRLSELGVKSWPKWSGPPGRYALTYDARQTCYIVRGKVKAAVEGSPEKDHVEFGAGDLVVFPKGTRCTWHITVAVDMHYAFDPS